MLSEARTEWWSGPGGPFGAVLICSVENRFGGNVADIVTRSDRRISTALVESDLTEIDRVIVNALLGKLLTSS